MGLNFVRDHMLPARSGTKVLSGSLGRPEG